MAHSLIPRYITMRLFPVKLLKKPNARKIFQDYRRFNSISKEVLEKVYEGWLLRLQEVIDADSEYLE